MENVKKWLIYSNAYLTPSKVPNLIFSPEWTFPNKQIAEFNFQAYRLCPAWRKKLIIIIIIIIINIYKNNNKIILTIIIIIIIIIILFYFFLIKTLS